VTPEDAKLLLLGKETKVKKCKKKDGGTFETRFVLNGTEVKFKFDQKKQENKR
jgi:hypothetical protein